MANRVPLVVANQKMREIADGDTLDLTGSSLKVGVNLTLGNLLLQDSGGALVTRDSASGPAVALGLGSNTTDDLTEGTSNLYFTNTRADARADSRIDTKLAGNVTIGGNLTVSGTETIINSTTLSVNDKTIIVADSAADSSAANGAGIEVGTAGASITYNHSDSAWALNRTLTVNAGGIAVKTNTGSVGYVDLYCESGNSHRVRMKSPTHSQYSGSHDVILPAEAGTLATVGASADTLLIKDSAGTTLKTIIGVGNTAL